jgi:hypothetical protein
MKNKSSEGKGIKHKWWHFIFGDEYIHHSLNKNDSCIETKCKKCGYVKDKTYLHTIFTNIKINL